MSSTTIIPPGKLGPTAYREQSPIRAARYFLGKFLVVRQPDGSTCAGVIWETEAYGGAEDGACHGYKNRRTPRTEVIFRAGGCAYVYLCYGIHFLFNIVIGVADKPQAVLIRAVTITDGIEAVRARRGHLSRSLWGAGPGRVTTALGITMVQNKEDLTGNAIWIEDRGVKVPAREVIRTPRIGVDYAPPEWVAKPWRLVWTGGEKFRVAEA